MSKPKTTQADKALIGLAGEYHVLAQLAERGIVGALTLGHTKGVDILAHNPHSGTTRRVEVKTTRAKPGRARLFGSELFYSWTLSAKHESEPAHELLFAFVHLAGPGAQPKVFIVPGRTVARYVKYEHRRWLEDPTPVPHKDNAVRQFRIAVSDPEGFSANWRLFE